MRNRYLLFPILIVLLSTSAACSGSSSGSSSASDTGPPSSLQKQYPELAGKKAQSFKVKRVVDGDTFETESKEKIRLIGVDTPETVKPGTAVQPFGKEASAYTKKRLTGRTIWAFSDVDDKDRYGRLLRYVFVEDDSRMYNEELVAEGYAHVMTVPPNVMYAKTFQLREREARTGKKGLWSDRYAAPSPSAKAQSGGK